MPNTKPVGVAYEDQYLNGATIENPVYTAKGAALTAQLTTITSTAPVTPDYAIQDLTQTTPFGFVTKDEGNSVLSVIANLQTRVSQLESRLQALGLIT
jgi:hypothetical protein